MPLRIPYGIDPDETWEVDFAKASADRMLERLDVLIADQSAAAGKETDEAKRAAILKAVEEARSSRLRLAADLADYKPGSGPIFIVGAIPNGKRAELLGEAYEFQKLDGVKALEVGDLEWSENVVRWAVRGHRNLTSGKSGKPLTFAQEDVPFAGGTRKVVSRKTLEAYGPFVKELALVVLRAQRIDEAGKNA